MNPLLALAGVCLFIFWVLSATREKGTRISPALWIPTTWLLIGASRPVTGWMRSAQSVNAQDGSPVDRAILTVLIGLAILVLSGRTSAVSATLRRNAPVVLFLTYCCSSILWSDFPLVTFKRLIRGIGDLCMILVITTDRHWETALKRVLERVAFVLIPLSVVIIKYLPEYGRTYKMDGSPMWTGVCTDKNGLGAICMTFGMALVWRLLPLGSSATGRHRETQGQIARVAVVALTFYLVAVIDSKTALACFAVANTLIVVTWLSPIFRKPAVLTTLIASMVFACYCVLFLGIGGGALQAMGRDPSLTGRTTIWGVVLPLVDNALLGAAYENFWMGDRLAAVMRSIGVLNQAHNGYLELYLNLGWIGLICLAGVIVIGYHNLILGLRNNSDLGRLKAAFFTVCLIYNFTEATFKMMSPVWITFLWATMASADSSGRMLLRTATLPATKNGERELVSHGAGFWKT